MMCGIRILNIPCKGMSMRVVLVPSRPFRSVIILNPSKLCGGRKIPGNGPRRVKLKSSRDPIPSVKSLICIVKDRHNPIMLLLKHPAPDGRSGCGRKIPWNILMKLSSNHIPSVIKVLSVEPIRCGGNKEREMEHERKGCGRNNVSSCGRVDDWDASDSDSNEKTCVCVLLTSSRSRFSLSTVDIFFFHKHIHTNHVLSTFYSYLHFR